MGETVKVAEAEARFSALQARVEAGEDFVIARGHIPVACLEPLEPMPALKPGSRPIGKAIRHGRR